LPPTGAEQQDVDLAQAKRNGPVSSMNYDENDGKISWWEREPTPRERAKARAMERRARVLRDAAAKTPRWIAAAIGVVAFLGFLFFCAVEMVYFDG
jgi:hypothetical protein